MTKANAEFVVTTAILTTVFTIIGVTLVMLIRIW